MHTSQGPLRFLLALLIAVLGLALAAPTGVAAQADDADDEDPTPAITTQEGDADAEPPDCDDDWRVVTTEDGAGFRNEDHCEDHVDRYGADSLVTVDPPGDDEYVVVTIADQQDGGCHVNVSLVGGKDGQIVGATIKFSNGAQFLPTFVPAEGAVDDYAIIGSGSMVITASAQLLNDHYQPTEQWVDISWPSRAC